MPKQKSILKNGIYNFIKTFANLVFPIVTFSYASRILGAEGLGQVNFASSVVSYFSMLALLGMNYYGVREGARRRDDKDIFSKFAHEMLMINGVTTVLAYILLAVAMLSIPKMREYRLLILVFSANILFNGMGLDWLYSSMEEYRYITVCALGFKIVSFIALFILVHDAKDIVVYSFVQMIATTGSHIMNFINARKFVTFKRYDNYEIKKHLRPIMLLFVMALSIELYTVLDTTMIGFMLDDAAVGRYTAAVKVNKMMNTLITAVGAVMVPRFSYCIQNREHEKVKSLLSSVYNFVFLLSIPIAVGLFMFSDEFILLFSGEGYASAGFTMRLLTPIVIIIPFSIVANLQIFVPMEKEKLILQSTLTGAVTNFTFNMLLIPRFAENGAAAATVLAETAVAIVCFRNIGKFYDRKQIFAGYAQYWLAAAPIPVIILLLDLAPFSYIFRMCAAIPLCAACYFAILFAFKNPYLLEGAQIVARKFKRRSNAQ